jgi:hypothetical protein
MQAVLVNNKDSLVDIFNRSMFISGSWEKLSSKKAPFD